MRLVFWVRGFLALALVLSFLNRAVYAQVDSPISYNFDLPLLLNPAIAGLNGDICGENASNHSFKLNYKNQFSKAFSSSSLKILSGSYEGRFFDKSMALGVSVYSNTLNSTAIKDLSVMVSYAYHWAIVKDQMNNPLHRLSFGVQGGIRRWAYDIEMLQTGSMYDPSYTGGFNPAMRPEYTVDESGRNVFDLQAGLHYSGTLISESLFLESGFSAYHLTRPETNFLVDGEKTAMRLAAYANVVWRSASLAPSSRAVKKGLQTGYGSTNVSEISGGIMFTNQASFRFLEISAIYALYITGDMSIKAGLAYRTLSNVNVFMPLVGMDIYDFTLNFQCDLYASTASSYNNLFGLGVGYRF